MATPAQLDEKATPAASSTLDTNVTPAQLAEEPKPKESSAFDGIATPAQLQEKARQDQAYGSSSTQGFASQAHLDKRARKDHGPSFATPAQFAEKARRIQEGSSFATPAQLAEKVRRIQDGSQASSPPLVGFAASAQLSEQAQGRLPPLPPRTSSTAPPPAYSSDDAKRSELISEQWRSHDPRSSSTHSLVPSESGRDGRRTLLLVFIHGFLGNETSFQSFPAHIHNLLTITLSETHVVHTKIYPRYKSRKVIEFARDDFSTWLEPHENNSTDVVLLGHSMGGILSAEVVLQKPISPATGKPFRHRILGTINFDTPFLGMHPGVVVSGIGSLFRPAPDPPGMAQQLSASGTTSPSLNSQASMSSSSYTPSLAETESSMQSLVQNITSPLASPSSLDPNFNPPFPNDVRRPERKGWTNLMHFVAKHSDGLTRATAEYFKSHLEFGGCLADYPGLIARYDKIRTLEDVDDSHREGPGYRPPVRRVRFLNYYTASTGRLKSPKIPPGYMVDEDGHLTPMEFEMQDMSLDASGSRSPTPTPSITVDEHDDGAITPQPLEEGPDASPIKTQLKKLGKHSGVQNEVQEAPKTPEMRHVDSMPMEDDDIPEHFMLKPTNAPEESTSDLHPKIPEPELPPIPAMPIEPEPINLDLYTDKDSRKVAEKEQKRVMKAYQTAIKDRESAIKDRKKLVEKREKKIKQEREKLLKNEEKLRLKEERERDKEEGKRKASISSPEPKGKERQASVTPSVPEPRIAKEEKKKKDKKFCMLPPQSKGERDETWVRIYMEGVDEVGAHCGLFFPGPHYESLVGDVGDRIDKWVEGDMSRRQHEHI